MNSARSTFMKVAAAAGVALAALGTASVAQARSDVYFSIGANVAPGVTLGVSNVRPYYPQPVYVQPAPVYYQPAPVYYQPAPVYYPTTYIAPPVYGVTYVWPARHHRHHRHHHYRY